MGKKAELKLEDFCIKENFFKLLENWTKTTGISTTVVNVEGEKIAPSFGMAEYCRMIQSCEKGEKCCKANWKKDNVGIYECHAGFYDFAIPIETPDGIRLGRVLAGQVLTQDQFEENIIKKAAHYNLSEKTVREVISRTPRKSQTEVEATYQLLKQMIDFFVEKSYQDWREHMKLYDVVSTAGLGLWRMTLFDGQKARLTCSEKMLELLGIDDFEMTEEELYEAWHTRIKKSALPSVNASILEMKDLGKSENIYAWIHPTLGERYIRCGGTGEKIEGKGYVLSGYYSDATESIHKEMRQKQLLADALEETKRQKELLQEALDNYKQADYDRRTDFLTGLKNRQDMYEMLNDDLSRARSKINAMYMMDIDNFKLFNDHYGHKAGDECLQSIGEALTEYGRKNSMYFYRYGGEEMLGISLSTEKTANMIAEELVKLVYDLQIKRDDIPLGVATISLGYTTDTSEFDKMIDKADAAMYEAKAMGKNQAKCYETSEIGKI